MKRFVVLLFVLLPISILYSQETINVPGDYSTIQAAINAANNGDLVLVADGIYQENIIFRGKAITVASHFIITGDTSHITHTIIDGSNPIYPDSASVVSFKSGEDTTSVICGFTIRGGTGTIAPNIRAGGGILVYNGGAKIKNNIIEYNSLDNIPKAYGGGIFTSGNSTNILIQNNIIRNNTCNGTEHALGGGIEIFTEMGYVLISNNKILDNIISGGGTTGGGIDIWGPITEVHIISNLIKGNMSQSNSGGGGGIDIYQCLTVTPILKNNVIVGNYSNAYAGGVYVDLPNENSFKSGMIKSKNTSKNGDVVAEQFFINNTIYNNNAALDGGGICTFDMTSTIINCILWGNTAQFSPQIAGTVDVSYSDIEGGWFGTGNIDIDPEFSDSTYFCLGGTSQCIDAGNPDPMYNDVGHIFNPGYAMPPAQDSLRNDMGHCGGPNSLWCHWNWPFTIELPSAPILISPSIGDTITLPDVTFNWEESNPMILRYWFELDTTDQFNDYFIDSVVVGNSLAYTSLEPNRNYYWRVKAYNFAAWSDFSEVWPFNTFITSVEDDIKVPIEFSLGQNYPNPFNPVTTIKYSIPAESEVSLIVYNTLGEEILRLVNESKKIGKYEVKFNAAALPSGVYLYQIKASSYTETKKMILMK